MTTYQVDPEDQKEWDDYVERRVNSKWAKRLGRLSVGLIIASGIVKVIIAFLERAH